MLKPVEIVAKLNRFVFSIDLVGYPSHQSDWYQKPRQQKFYTVWLISKGKGEIIIDGKSWIAEPGKLFVFVPGMVTERRNLLDSPFEHYVIRYSFTEAYQQQGQWIFNNDVNFPLQGNYTIQNVPQILHIFEELYHLWKRKGPMIVMRKDILFKELWLLIAQDFRSQKVEGSTTNSINLTIDYMVNHFRKELSLEELSAIAGISKSHYSRLFKKYTGYSPIEYLTQLRIGRAKELITLSDYKLKEIAHAVGYKDEFYFSRMFKKNVGISPSEYSDVHTINN
ncbi:AraC family transcriptional regulator [Radiobacillus sp. PE A8.2]|uniref:AraC family transcriptional regulator n=1 Tax=Radiobacillus sp. PE A8.2 TaxID=3380349 RepID=UPI00388D82EE